MKPRFAAVWTLEPSWTTPIAPRHTAAYSLPRAEAEETLAALTEKARSVESEPCQITPTFTEESEGVRLDIDFVFACEAETLIFQLGLR
ncbi:putative cytoplasmic protein [Salmonella enterica]|uniref:Putative cytoplasmic protein n=1 Tax=Salmonella sp. NCTC 6947 TaxID=2583581 RepID=A0A509BTH3_9ENTR|nr:putative cytoplasmic protein [Salmonella enterica]